MIKCNKTYLTPIPIGDQLRLEKYAFMYLLDEYFDNYDCSMKNEFLECVNLIFNAYKQNNSAVCECKVRIDDYTMYIIQLTTYINF